jgi:hypothetical protein
MFTLSQLLLMLDEAKVFPSDLDPGGRRSRVNQALEAVFLSGRFNGTQRNALFKVSSSGILTLPREALGLLASKVDGSVRELGSPWYSYLSGTTDSMRIGDTTFEDLGDGYCTFAQPKAPAKLRVACAGETQTVEVHGLDADGVEVMNGGQRGAILTPNALKSAPYFSKITQVIKPETDLPATLYACYDDSTEEPIGIYAPGETVPRYRAYFVPEANGQTATTVEAKVQLRHVNLIDGDIVPIGNFIALKDAVTSVHWKDEADETRADKHLNDAIKMLNHELQILRPPNERGAFRISAPYAGASGLRSMR